MTRTEALQSKAASIEADAADWLVRRDRGLDAGELAAFEAWRDEDTRHRVALLRLEAAWSQADRLAALGAGYETGPRRPSRFSRTPSWFARASQAGPMVQAMMVLSACAVLLTGGYVVNIQVWGSPLSTPVGGRTVEPLADGSRIEINTDSRVRVSVNGLRRKVWIDQGEVYFDIASNAARPFVIQAGERQITVVGTRFSVYREEEKVRVRVTEGLVDVRSNTRAQSVRARPGDEVAMVGRSLTVTHRGLEELEDELSWRSGRLVFQGVTLGEVAEAFNRYNTRKLRVPDPEAAAIRVGGAFSASNVTGFAALLSESYGLHAEVRPDEIIITR